MPPRDYPDEYDRDAHDNWIELMRKADKEDAMMEEQD